MTTDPPNPTQQRVDAQIEGLAADKRAEQERVDEAIERFNAAVDAGGSVTAALSSLVLAILTERDEARAARDENRAASDRLALANTELATLCDTYEDEVAVLRERVATLAALLGETMDALAASDQGSYYDGYHGALLPKIRAALAGSGARPAEDGL